MRSFCISFGLLAAFVGFTGAWLARSWFDAHPAGEAAATFWGAMGAAGTLDVSDQLALAFAHYGIWLGLAGLLLLAIGRSLRRGSWRGRRSKSSARSSRGRSRR